MRRRSFQFYRQLGDALRWYRQNLLPARFPGHPGPERILGADRVERLEGGAGSVDVAHLFEVVLPAYGMRVGDLLAILGQLDSEEPPVYVFGPPRDAEAYAQGTPLVSGRRGARASYLSYDLAAFVPGSPFSVTRTTLQAGAATAPSSHHRHLGQEIIYCIDGELILCVDTPLGEVEFPVPANHFAVLRAHFLHHVKNPEGRPTCRYLVVRWPSYEPFAPEKHAT